MSKKSCPFYKVNTLKKWTLLFVHTVEIFSIKFGYNLRYSMRHNKCLIEKYNIQCISCMLFYELGLFLLIRYLFFVINNISWSSNIYIYLVVVAIVVWLLMLLLLVKPLLVLLLLLLSTPIR